MAKKVQHDDLLAQDIFTKDVPSMKEYVVLLNQIEKGFKDVLKVSSKVSSKNVEAFNKATENRKQAVSGLNKVEKQRQQVLEKLSVLETKQGKELEASRIALTNKRKAVREEIKAEKGLTTEFEKQSKRLKKLKDDYKNLILQEGKQTKETRRLRKEALKLDKTLKGVNASVSSSSGLFSKLRGGVARLGLAFGGLAVIRNVFNTVKDFNQAQADLGAIASTATIPQLEALTENAKKLGAESRFSATEITNLQIELAKLGFSPESILQSTEAISNFAAATGAQLPEAAQLAGATLRAFGLDASEMERVVSTLGVATTKTGLDFAQLSTGMSTVAPVAKAFGFSIEDTTALLGQLANAGFDASSSATATRNILLNLADANGELAKELGRPIKNADDLAAGLQELEEKGIDLASALELTDKRSVAAFSTFLENAESLVPLRDSITDVNDELTDMAEKRLDTLEGSIALLKSAWEGLILDFEEGTGVFGGLKNVIGFVAANLKTIVKVVKTAAIAWLSYRIALKLVNEETGKFKKFGLISFFKKLITGLKGLAKGGKGAALSLKGIGTAMKSIPLVALISGLVTAVSIIWDLVSGTDAATRAQEELNAELREEIRLRKEQIEARRTELGDITERVGAIAKLSGTGVKQLGEDISSEIDKLQGELDIVTATVDKFDKKSKDAFNTWGDTKTVVSQTADGMFEVNEIVEEARKNQEISKETQSESKDELEKQLAVLRDQLIIVENFEPLNKKRVKSGKKELTGLEALRAKLAKINKLRSDELVIRGRTAEFDLLTKNVENLEDEITLLEEKLKLTKDIEKVEVKKATDIAEIQGDVKEEAQADVVPVSTGIEEENENIEEALQRRKDLFANALQAISELIQEQADKRVEAIDKEIAANQRRQDVLRDISKSGAADTKESIAFELKKEAELEQQKKDLIKRAANIEAGLALLGTYQSNIASGQEPTQALANTAVSAAALKQLIGSLDFFYKGTEDTGTADNPLDSNGGRLAVLHDNERVMTAEQNKQVSGLTNWELASAGATYKKGIKDVDTAIKVQQFQSNTELLNKFDKIEQAIKDQPVPNTTFYYDSFKNASIKSVETKGKIENHITKHRGLW